MKKKLLIGIIALIGAILIFGGGYFLGEGQVIYQTIYIVDEEQEQITKIARDTTFECPAYSIKTIDFSDSLCQEWITDKNGAVIFIPPAGE